MRAQLGSEGVAREVEDAVNELQRQMGEFERSVSEHQNMLDMTCRLQQAMEEVRIRRRINPNLLKSFKNMYVLFPVSVLVRGGECDHHSRPDVFLRLSQHRGRHRSPSTV